MNSLRMYVQDTLGTKFLFTCATNREGQTKAFRRHANWWLKTGYKDSPVYRQPCFPCKIIIEPYNDEESNQ